MPKAFPLLSLIICLMAVFILCALGMWQVERLSWKNNLQQQLDSAFSNHHPAAFTEAQFQTLEKGQVIRGTAKGQLDIANSVIFHGRLQDGKTIFAVVAPFKIKGTDMIVPIEMGCKTAKDIQDFAKRTPVNVMVKGVLREPSWSFATPQNNPQKHEWWRMDHQQLGAYWGHPNLKNAFITAENSKDFDVSLTPCPIEKTLRNDHFSYAIFWFLMAGILSVMWGIRFLKPYLQSA